MVTWDTDLRQVLLHYQNDDQALFGLAVRTVLVSGKLIARCGIRIESAWNRNLEQPDWEGLGALGSPALSSRGAVEVPIFQNWLSGMQKDKAVVMKPGRLLREVRASELRRNPKGPKEPVMSPPVPGAFLGDGVLGAFPLCNSLVSPRSSA